MKRLSGLILSSVCLFSTFALAQTVPHYKVDPYWPKELPNNWVLGQVRGIAVDHEDHIWVLNEGAPPDNVALAKTPPTSQCCVPAPSVIEFDHDGNVLQSWGKPGFIADWPTSPHGITVDKEGNIWIGGVGNPWNSDPGTKRPTDVQPWDRQVLKFSGDGKLLLEIGKPSNAPMNNRDTSLMGAPSAVTVDDAANEVYVADGFLNRRIVVFDSNTGAFKRGWGANGIPLADIDNSNPAAFPVSRDVAAPPSKQFKGITDITLSNDGLVYVTDQMNGRMQVFTRQGKFVKEFAVAPKIAGYESTWSIALSRDQKQKYLFVSDGDSGVIRIIDRHTGAEIGKQGHKGRNAGQYGNLGWVVIDSHGTLYTGEVHFTRSWDGNGAVATGKVETPGGRLQRFVLEK